MLSIARPPHEFYRESLKTVVHINHTPGKSLRMEFLKQLSLANCPHMTV
jgi:hypothetical protein